MNWGWLLSLLLKILGLFRGGGTRIRFEARSEASIDMEQERRKKENAMFQKRDDELTQLVVAEAEARTEGRVSDADKLLVQLHERLKDYRTAKSGSEK